MPSAHHDWGRLKSVTCLAITRVAITGATITRVTSVALTLLAASAASAQVQTTLAADGALPRLTEWLAPGADVVRALTERPPETFSPDIDAAAAPFLVSLGRLAFRSPLIFGTYAARGGLSCDVCHTAGGTNRDFFVAEVSDRAGNVDVTHGFWRRESEDGLTNPINIPSLRGVRWTAPYGRDGRFASLEDFTRNVIVHEFAGDEPSPLVVDALVAYQRLLAFPGNANLGAGGRLTPAAGPQARRGETWREEAGREETRRGEALFLRDCAGCHVPSGAFIDGRAHDVGTGGHFDTPTLLGLAASAPYFHDGRAPGLPAVISHFENALGLDYDSAQRDGLVTYLEAVGAAGAPTQQTLAGDVADLDNFAAVLDFPLNDEDAELSDLIAAMLRTEVGRIAERFPPASHGPARTILEAWSGGLAAIAALSEADRFPAARTALEIWRARLHTDLPALARTGTTSLYDPATLRRALESAN